MRRSVHLRANIVAALVLASSPAAADLSGAVSPQYPQKSKHFRLSGQTVTAHGSTASLVDADYFLGENGLTYSITIPANSVLTRPFDNSATGDWLSPFTPQNTPYGEVIAISNGSITNHGTLTTYPVTPGAHTYKRTGIVVYISISGSVVNTGTIGDDTTPSINPGYAEEDSMGVYVNAGSVVNTATGKISGYNGVYGAGTGTFTNYGYTLGINDGFFGSFSVINEENAFLGNTNSGFASAHVYNNIINRGYMLGNDLGILEDFNNNTITIVGGGPVAGVFNFDGSQVYNGEVSALARGPETPCNNPISVTSCDAINLDGSNVTVNLVAQKVRGTVWAPKILGPMIGGVNGNFSSATAHSVNNTLAFYFDALPSVQKAALKAAIAASAQSNVNGTFYSGSVALGDNTYVWSGFANVVMLPGTPPELSPRKAQTPNR